MRKDKIYVKNLSTKALNSSSKGWKLWGMVTRIQIVYGNKGGAQNKESIEIMTDCIHHFEDL